jgi:two-component system response regulator GlrR
VLRGKMLEKKILLVDDEESILQTYALLLEENGYYVVTANCGRKALEEFHLHSFNLLITDLVMDDGDGFYLIDAIENKYPHIPVIVFTGKASNSVSKYVSLLGVCALIEKPCSNEKFISCVNNSLGTIV